MGGGIRKAKGVKSVLASNLGQASECTGNITVGVLWLRQIARLLIVLKKLALVLAPRPGGMAAWSVAQVCSYVEAKFC